MFYLKSSLLVGAACFSLLGCAGKNAPESLNATHQKNYTIEELETKYRNIPKLPSDFKGDSDSIAAQERRFDAKIKRTFSEIDSFKKKLSNMDSVAAKKEAQIYEQIKIAKAREEDRERAKSAIRHKTMGSVIDAYFN
ncbi:MAG TPA: hypothetical protein ENN12_03520 [Epsilonproteobacteria bacterium]|nr:hypothetical protein [Campylobacterota bacterium]